ncbi:MAG: dipeptidase [Myxococcaceae bacterium]
MRIADAHADALLWNRPLERESRRGHVDFPRLLSANVRLQCFTLVTRGFPWVGGFELFARWRGWPREARASPWERANFQIDQLHQACAASGGVARVAQRVGDIDETWEQGGLACVLGLEGAAPLEGKLERLRLLRERGVAFVGPMHLSNNEMGGSSHPAMGNRPLTALGHALVEEAGRLGMAIDVAHASRQTLSALLEQAHAKVFCSHTGMAALAAPWRNLEDGHCRAIAERGGVVSIIFSPIYLGGRKLDDVARHVAHAVKVAGEDAVALGSDFDGLVPMPKGIRDAGDLPKLVEALTEVLPERVVEKVVGANLVGFFRSLLRHSPTPAR